jgi:hypothetical protein
VSAGSDKQIVLHVGLHKTGTTFLQERVFPALPGVRFVHPYHRPRPGDGPIERYLLELFFRNAAGIDVEAHRRRIHAWLAELEEPIVLVSSEAIVGWAVENHSNIALNADFLQRVFPDAKVLLVVRRQDQWAESAYSQLLKAGWTTTMARYLNWDGREFGRYNIGLYNGPNVDARDLDWAAFDGFYRRVFGEDRVSTLPFELFREDSRAFLERLYDFAGIEEGVFPDSSQRVNRSWSRLSIGVARVVNAIPMPIKLALRERVDQRWHPSAVLARTVDPLLGPLLGGRKAKQMDPDMARALLEVHAAGNRALAERIGIDLGAYGYHP